MISAPEMDRTIIQGVEPTCREALQRLFLAGLSYHEIARSLKLPSDAVRSRLAHGKDQRRAALSPRAALPGPKRETPEPREPDAPPTLT